MTTPDATAEYMAQIHARAFAGRRAWRRDEFSVLIKDPHIFCQTHAQGFILIRHLAPEAEILTIAVDPRAQLQGIGTALLRAGLSYVAENGVQKVFLEMDADDSLLLKFYHKQGFETLTRRTKYYRHANGDLTDALILERRL